MTTKSEFVEILKSNGFTGSKQQMILNRVAQGDQLRVTFGKERGFVSVFIDIKRHFVTGRPCTTRVGGPLQTYAYDEVIRKMGFQP